MSLESIPVNECTIVPSWKKADVGTLLQLTLSGTVTLGMKILLPGANTPALALFNGAIVAPHEDSPAVVVNGHLEIGISNPGMSLERDKFKPGIVYAISEGPLFLCAGLNGGSLLICVRGGTNYKVGENYFNVGSMPSLYEVGSVELRVIQPPTRVIGY